jgi:Flp pilus assembly protein TadG
MLTFKRRIEDERGVTLILVAVIMIALLGIAGLVLDLGLVRADRQRNKGVADVAVSAGMRASSVSGGQIGTFQGACAALDYLKTNHPELSTLSLTSGWTKGDGTTAITPSGNPCDATSPAYSNYGTLCNPLTSTTAQNTSAWFTGSTGTIDVKVRAGYSNATMTADGFRDDFFHTDAGDPDYNGCDQLAVIVTERETAGFGKVIGGGQLASTIRSVGRLTFDDSSEAAVALLLIEPTGCEVLKIGGAGSAVRVKGTDTRPGIIHADSTGAGCSGSNRVLTGLHTNGIIAERAPNPVGTGAAGIVSAYANIPSPAYDSTTNVVAEGGTPQNNLPKGRGPVDERYLGVGSSYGMIDLRGDALTRFAWTTATVPSDYDIVTGTAACKFPGGTYTPPTGKTKVFINCDLAENVTFASHVTDVVVNGNMNLNGKTVVMPDVRNVFVKGTTSPTRGIDINSSGRLSVNMGSSLTCALREDAARTKITRLVVGAGPVSVGSGTSTFQACGTTVFLLGGAGTFPTANGTAPAGNSYNGNLNIGSTGTVDWTAPNTTSALSVAADWEKFEDLAFWTETSGGNSISGAGATMALKGIFFTPNADAFNVNAGSGGITADAQFITRKLNNQGGGTLTLTADPNNSVPYKIISGYELVR